MLALTLQSSIWPTHTLNFFMLQTCAQVMLTLDNLANRAQFTNACNTFTELFAYGIVPIVNENDTVATEEIRIGDNDTLSAKVSLLSLPHFTQSFQSAYQQRCSAKETV